MRLETVPVGKWMHAVGPMPSPSGKTLHWAIYESANLKGSGRILGRISWFSSWRRYAFYPRENTVFERECLRALADFCDEKTRAHSEKRRARVANQG